jgi:hypothetical protein
VIPDFLLRPLDMQISLVLGWLGLGVGVCLADPGILAFLV